MKRKKKKTKNKILLFFLSLILLFVAGAKLELIDVQEVSQSALHQFRGIGNNVSKKIKDTLGVGPETKFNLTSIPAYDGKAYVTINNNIPNFTTENLTTESFESYSNLDFLGRCGTVIANIGRDIMPKEERGSIGMIKPTGWHTVKYDVVDDKYLYNRCHLIGYQLTGENANECNLITGTRYLNVEGMLPFENDVASYVRKTGNHVLYRVTPVFEGTDLLAKGVLMEAISVEDMGQGIMFHVFCYNVQPGVEIDYSDGSSRLMEEKKTNSSIIPMVGNERIYICNTNTQKFHDSDCSSVYDMKEKNKKVYQGDRDELIANGYSPCKSCNP